MTENVRGNVPVFTLHMTVSHFDSDWKFLTNTVTEIPCPDLLNANRFKYYSYYILGKAGPSSHAV